MNGSHKQSQVTEQMFKASVETSLFPRPRAEIEAHLFKGASIFTGAKDSNEARTSSHGFLKNLLTGMEGSTKRRNEKGRNIGPVTMTFLIMVETLVECGGIP